MKTPRILIGAVLVFWGWQTGFLVIGLLMATVLESAHWLKARWEFSDDDFSRIWTICTLLFLGAALYAFTDNAGPARIGSFFQDPTLATKTSAGAATSRTASAILRWLPMVLFLFVAAQAYSARTEIPVSTISLILRRRWKKAIQLGRPVPEQRGMNVSYPYFGICLFAASVHPGENNYYFWGLCFLLTWALWSQRTRRFSLVVWASALAVAFTFGYFGQHGIGRLQGYLQNIDPQWFERFAQRRDVDPSQSKTQLGRLGRLKLSGKIVIRLEPKDGSTAPEYLREASYRIFNGNVWRAGASRENFQAVAQETNSAGFLLVPGKLNLAKVNITCYLEGYSREAQTPIGLLPLPAGAGRLDNLPVFVLKANNLGAVLAEGPGLLNFDASYGPGAMIDSPFNAAESLAFTNNGGFGSGHRRSESEGNNEVFFETNPDLFVSPKEEQALDQVVAGWKVPRGNRPLAMRAITSFFQSNFTYSTWQELPDFKSTNQTPLGLFLLRTHSGHCEYFASATVLLLRVLGVPARYAVGFAVHEKSGKEYVVRLRDGHAWCLVWNEKSRSWQDFDTTPPSWIEEEAKNASAFQKVSDLWSWLEFQFSKFRWGQSNLRQYMLLSIVPAFCLLGYQIFFRQKRRRRRPGQTGESPNIWPGLDSEFYLLEKQLAVHSIIRHPDESLSRWRERALAHPACAEIGDPLQELLELHYRYRFDPNGLTDADREKLRRAANACLQTIALEQT